MRGAEIGVDERRERRALQPGDCVDRLGAIAERVLDRLGDKLVAGGEVPVEAAVREAGFLHQVCDADALDTLFAKAGGRVLHDAVMALRFLRLRVAHLPILGPRP
jgi:hypothetical protein